MPIIKTVVTLNKETLIERDAVKLTMVWDPADANAATLDTIGGRIIDFFNLGAAGSRVCDFLSATISGVANAHRIDFTDISDHLDGSAAGSPFRTDTFGLAARSNSEMLPDEVAVRVSIRGDMSGVPEESPDLVPIPTPASAQRMGAPATHLGRRRPRASRRGGFYVGPLGSNILDPGVQPEEVHVSNGFRTVLLGAVTGLATPSAPSGAIVVWSRANAQTFPVRQVVVDNALDTVRRRGVRHTARSIQNIAP